MSGSPTKGMNCTLDGPVVDTSATKHQAKNDTGSLHSRRMESPVSPGPSPSKGGDDSKRVSEMQLQWHDGICNSMNLADGYEHIAVLIINWTDHLDDLGCSGEVKRVDELFRERMHYETEILELNGATKPQLQLVSALSNFAHKHNGPSSTNLLIIYYTGHSYFHEDTMVLEFYGGCKHNDDSTSCPERCASKQFQAEWNRAEEVILKDVDADTLAILDTCFASDVQKNMQEDSRTYQLLAASGRGRTTSGPGPNSFTTALLKAFDELLNEKRSFNTHKLLEYINHQPLRRNNPAFLYDRQKRYENWIMLQPLIRDVPAEKNSICISNKRTKSCLTLEFALAHTFLKKEQIDNLTKHLVTACKSSNVIAQNIRWHGFKHRSPLWAKAFCRIRAMNSFKKLSHPNNSAISPLAGPKPNIPISLTSINEAEARLNTPSAQTTQLAVAAEGVQVVSEHTVVNSISTVVNEDSNTATAGRGTSEREQPLTLNKKGLLCLVAVCFIFGDVFHLAIGIAASIVTIVLCRSPSRDRA